MSETVSASTKTFPIILTEGRGAIGVLELVDLEYGAAIAQINDKRYEAPAELYNELQSLVGQRAIIACIAGQVRVGRRST